MVFWKVYVERLLILILMFSVGVFASGGENNNDISNKAKSVNTSDIKYIPYLSRHGWGYDGFIFTSSGKEFYTYKNGILHHWQLMPVIKHLDSISINFFVPKRQSMKFGIQPLLYFSPEEDKMLFYRKDFIEIWDLKKKKMIVNKKINSMASVMINKSFFTLDKNFLIQQWSLDGLEEVKRKSFKSFCTGRIYGRGCERAILISDKKDIYIIYNSQDYSIIHINPETLTKIRYKYVHGLSQCSNITADKKFITCRGFRFRLEDFTTIYSNTLQNQKIFPPSRFLRYFIFGDLHIYRKIFIDREKTPSFGSSLIVVKLLKNDIYQFFGVFYHNDKGNWYFKESYKVKHFDSDLSFKELEMYDVSDYSKKKRMSEEIYNRYFKKINFEDLKNGKD